MIEYRQHITRTMIQAEPGTLFVFGDNFARKGMGGQAKEMRGEPNAVGIATKRAPSMAPSAFLRDSDEPEWHNHTVMAAKRLREHKGLIVWPKTGIGYGLARLDQSSPLIAKKIKVLHDELL